MSVNRTLRLANKKLVSERSVRFYYFFYGCIMFVFVPSLLFIQAEEDWTYLDAVYFSVISLTKIGFGDYVPSTTPPNKFANTLLNATSCLANLTSPNPSPPGVQMPEGFFSFCFRVLLVTIQSVTILNGRSRSKSFLACIVCCSTSGCYSVCHSLAR